MNQKQVVSFSQTLRLIKDKKVTNVGKFVGELFKALHKYQKLNKDETDVVNEFSKMYMEMLDFLEKEEK